MPPIRDSRSELVRLVRRIQELTLELEKLRTTPGTNPEVEAKERTRDQLRWRLAAIARQAPTNSLDSAA